MFFFQFCFPFFLAIGQFYILKWTGREPTQESYLEQKRNEYDNLLATKLEESKNATTSTPTKAFKKARFSCRRRRQSNPDPLLPVHQNNLPSPIQRSTQVQVQAVVHQAHDASHNHNESFRSTHSVST